MSTPRAPRGACLQEIHQVPRPNILRPSQFPLNTDTAVALTVTDQEKGKKRLRTSESASQEEGTEARAGAGVQRWPGGAGRREERQGAGQWEPDSGGLCAMVRRASVLSIGHSFKQSSEESGLFKGVTTLARL